MIQDERRLWRVKTSRSFRNAHIFSRDWCAFEIKLCRNTLPSIPIFRTHAVERSKEYCVTGLPFLVFSPLPRNVGAGWFMHSAFQILQVTARLAFINFTVYSCAINHPWAINPRHWTNSLTKTIRRTDHRTFPPALALVRHSALGSRSGDFMSSLCSLVFDFLLWMDLLQLAPTTRNSTR